MRSSSRFVVFSSAIAGATVPSTTWADSQTASFDVSIRIVPSCTTWSDNFDFGKTGDSSPTIAITCSGNSPWSMRLSAGTGEGAIATTRVITSANGNTVDHALFTDASHSILWVDQTVAGSGPGTTIPPFGRIPANQRMSPGSYIDTVTVTVTY